MTTEQRNTLAADLQHALGAFERWMNRPLAKVQVYTWKLANDLDSNCPCIRLLRPYRDEANKKFRWRLAQWLKSRRHVGRIALPVYDERSGMYQHDPPAGKWWIRDADKECAK